MLCRSSPQSCPSGSPQLKCSVDENASGGRKSVGLALQCWLLAQNFCCSLRRCCVALLLSRVRLDLRSSSAWSMRMPVVVERVWAWLCSAGCSSICPISSEKKSALCGKPIPWLLARHSAWLLFGLCTYSIAAGTGPTVTASATSHGKKLLTNYSVIGIPGDGRCLFRAVAHGAHVRKGLGAPSESIQRESADALRGKVVDELVKRREETEWFIEGDFDSYTKRMRQPYVWGGEPELLMASHVLRMPITVYMFEQRARGLISIAEYGQEYAKENSVPIRVLYHGFGHYDALQLADHHET
ncbi:hypothetical protein L7F22_041554 [Adiantum nelumboides]|nr:hypothetical protein [Adiantum nelumboides]